MGDVEMSRERSRHEGTMERKDGRSTKASAGWATAAALVLAGCGNVIVDGDTGTGDTTGPIGTGGAGGTTSGSTSSTVVTTTTTSASTGSGSTSGTIGGGCGGGCNDAVTIGSHPCDGPGFAYYGALLGASCGSMSMCGFPCNGNLCNFGIPTTSCLSCVEANYPGFLQQCMSN
jgi:hypothetical protein